MSALILTYHAIERGPPPLCIEPALFRRHLDVIAASGASVTSLDRLVAEDRSAGGARPTVAITFDDGFASVVEEAAPALRERQLAATVFPVAGYLGALNDWPTQASWAPRRLLASAAGLAELARAGFEIGSHGVDHVPLRGAAGRTLRREVLESRQRLEDATGVPVRWYAYPYGYLPGREGRELVRRAYAGACAGGPVRVGARADRFALPRVDAHYLRRPALLDRALKGRDAYLRMRHLGGGVRRLLRPDHREG